MDWKKIGSNWDSWKKKIQEEWPKLTDKDLDSIGGDKLRLADKISEEYAITELQAEREVIAWQSSLTCES